MKSRFLMTAVMASAALACLGPITTARAADSDKVQKQKNDWRNIAIGAGAIAAHGALKGNGLETIIGAAGAAYAGKKYEDTRREQSADARERARYHRGSSTYTVGPRKYYWYNGQQYVLDTRNGDRQPVTNPPDQQTVTRPSRREYHRSDFDRKYYMFNGHQYYMNMNTGARVMLD